jgi:hypothetical protein
MLQRELKHFVNGLTKLEKRETLRPKRQFKALDH